MRPMTTVETRRWPSAPRLVPPTVDMVVATRRPDNPLLCVRPAALAAGAAAFRAAFPGRVLYAVKCNPAPSVLDALHAGGIAGFDCASPAEIALVRARLPGAEVKYMHPVKAPAAIRTAYSGFGVRDFALDSLSELDRIRTATDGRDLGLIVRLALPRARAAWDLSGKFGAAPADAARILAAARRMAARIGITFHVGSQCLDPDAYVRAIRLAGEVAAAAGVALDILDVGGGFPVAYPEVEPPPFSAFVAAIAGAAEALPGRPELWAEPGRALAAPGVSLVVRVIERRGDALFVNDGVYGSLSDAGAPGFRFPARLIRPDGGFAAAPARPFRLFGPTCDSADRMEGPFVLPGDVAEGDWIEIGQLGAYGAALRTAFNGFGEAEEVAVSDPPLLPIALGQGEERAVA